MKYEVPQVTIICPVLFITIGLLCSVCWTLITYGVISIPMIREYDSSFTVKIHKSQNSILYSLLYKHRCLEEKVRLNKEKSSIKTVDNSLQLRDIELPLKTKNLSIWCFFLSLELRNPGIALVEN